jgi:hypothetical protein
MLYSPDGQPVRSIANFGIERDPAMEARINAELQALDSNIHIRIEGRYALCFRWPQGEKRWQEVQQGRMDPNDAFDILGWFTEDMASGRSTPVNPEQFKAKAFELLHKIDNTRFPWKGRVERSMQKNDVRQQQLKEEAVDRMTDAASDAYYHSNRASRVFTGKHNLGGKE